jgi:hypothetical protein
LQCGGPAAWRRGKLAVHLQKLALHVKAFAHEEKSKLSQQTEFRSVNSTSSSVEQMQADIERKLAYDAWCIKFAAAESALLALKTASADPRLCARSSSDGTNYHASVPMMSFDRLSSEFHRSLARFRLLAREVDTIEAIVAKVRNESPLHVEIHCLPYEVLQSIFLTTVSERISHWPYEISFRQRSVLSKVCSRWHVICRDTSSLWTYVDLTHGNPTVSRILQRSKGRSLSLHLVLELDRREDDIYGLSMLTPLLANLHTLAVTGSPKIMARFISLYRSRVPTGARSIQNLYFRVNGNEVEADSDWEPFDATVQDFLDSFEFLSVVELNDILLRRHPPTIRNLVVLKFSTDNDVSADELDECLKGCPFVAGVSFHLQRRRR